MSLMKIYLFQFILTSNVLSLAINTQMDAVMAQVTTGATGVFLKHGMISNANIPI